MTVPRQRTAVVTGANKGLGFAIAKGLLELGLTVFVGARDRSRGASAVAELAGRGGEARLLPLDVADQDSVNAAADLVRDEVGSLDVLINNAGILHTPIQPPSLTAVDELRTTFETNVYGIVAVTNALLPLLRRSSAARIVNLTSDLGSLTRASQDHHFPTLLAYNTSKTAVNALTITYANELRADAILVNAVSPGSVATDQNGHAGTLTPDQGAQLPIRMALLPADGPTGTAVTAAEDLSEHLLPW